MRKGKLNILRALVIVFAIILLLPFFQNRFLLVNVGKLEGAFVPAEIAVFNFEDWFDGRYQLKTEEYINESFGFRNLFVRLNNQVSFNLFKKANADNIVVGKSNYLFQRPTINAYYGRDFMGVERIEERVRQLKFISDTLAKFSKSLILVLGTGKGSFFPEFIPDKLKSEKRHSNIESHVNAAVKYNLSFIDFNSYFINLKSTSVYPLFPAYGIHWSRYGAYLVTDSLIHYIEKLRQIDMPNIKLDSLEFRQPENEDYDIAGGMNLLFRLKSFDMAYPVLDYESDSGRSKPKMLVIGDSFYWGLQNMEIDKSFSTIDFWFYNKRGTAGALKELSAATKIDMAGEVKNYDIIMLLCTEANLPELGWGFIESTYLYYKGVDKTHLDDAMFNEALLTLKEKIKSNPERMRRISGMALESNISIDSMLTRQAAFRLKNKREKEKNKGSRN